MAVRVAGARAERLAKKTWEFLASLPDGALPDDAERAAALGGHAAAHGGGAVMAQEQDERGARFTWQEGGVRWHTPAQMAEIEAGISDGAGGEPASPATAPGTFWTRARLEQTLEEIPLMDGVELYRLARLMVAELWLHATGEQWMTPQEAAVAAAALGIVDVRSREPAL